MEMQEINRLYGLAIAGDEGAARELAVANLWRAKTIARSFVNLQQQASHLEEDLESSGVIAIFEAVGAIKRGKIPVKFLASYLNQCVRNALRDAFLHSPAFGPKRWVIDERRRSEKPSGEFSQHSLLTVEASLAGVYRNGKPMRQKKERSKTQLEMEAIDALDEIEMACGCPRDLAFVRLRAQGFTDAEIAKQLRVGRRSVERTRQSLSAILNYEALDLLHELTDEEVANRWHVSTEAARSMPRALEPAPALIGGKRSTFYELAAWLANLWRSSHESR